MALPLADFQGEAIYVDTNVREMRTSGILPRDAIHLAVMKRRGLAAIASDDEGFDNRQDITLVQP
jgi:predicted nucleic acid-binding protein